MYNKKVEHGFKLFDKRIKEGKFKNPLLFYGQEGYLIDWAIAALKKKYITPGCASLDFSIIDGLENELYELEDGVATISMFSQKRIIVVKNFFAGKSKLKNEEELLGLLNSLSDGVLVVFLLEDEIKDYERNFLVRYARENGECFDFAQLEKRSLDSFIRKKFKASGIDISPALLALLISESGYYTKENDYGLYNLTNDIEKIIDHSDGEVTKEDIKEVISNTLEHNTFALLDAISENRKEEALRLMRDMLLSGESVFMLIGATASQLEILLMVKEMKEEGVPLKEMIKVLKIHEFRVKKALNLTNKYTTAKIRRILIGLYSCEEKIKSGKLDEEIALELFIAQI